MQNQPGHRPLRECLPSVEREDYIRHVRMEGCTFITERQKNRYIDEFLRFCKEYSNHSDATKIRRKDLVEYGKRVKRTSLKIQTARTKLLVVLQWLRWLAGTGRIKENPANGLQASELIGTSKEWSRS